MCTGQRRPHERDETVVLFIKLRNARRAPNDLREKVKLKIQEDLSRRHVPKHVFYVEDIPYSHVGKKLEILVKKIISGQAVAQSHVVANPESIRLYEKFYDIEKVAREDAMGVSTAKL